MLFILSFQWVLTLLREKLDSEAHQSSRAEVRGVFITGFGMAHSIGFGCWSAGKDIFLFSDEVPNTETKG